MKTRSEAKAAPVTPAMPLDAVLQASGAWSQVPTQILEGWQRQLNVGLRMMEAMLANAARIRDAQLPAMGEEVARVVDLQRSLLAATSPYEAWSCQCNWMIESATRAMKSWNELLQAAGTANASLMSSLRDEAAKSVGDQPVAQASVVAPGGSVATQDLVKTALVSVDAAYGQMVKGTQQMMAAATEALNAGLRMPAPTKPVAKRGA